ncbi:hypothetical protein, partial [Streptomyces sp. 067-1]|uniref:hypothetical protein n=1 Tax=Streptomyces sp. 067-1 TaxID=2789269 RepID=UPI0039F4934C
FAAGTNAVSSNYYLDQLGYDPTRVQQRLGDAFYEQQLVAQQLTALTGGTRLAGYGDNQDQYQALLGSGAAYAKEFGLSLGVGLTAEQMASLTTDIVLLVDVVVEGPNGPTHALAPIVYLAKTHEGDLQESGALIAAGGQLSIRSAGDLTNSGVIRASLGSDIAVEGRLTNAGTIAGGKVATITAGGDLISQGGSFTGGDLTLSAGGNMVLGATRSTQHSATAYAGGGTLTDSITHQV